MATWGDKRKIAEAKQAVELRRMMYPHELPSDVEPAEMIDTGEEMLVIVELEEPRPKGTCKKCNRHIGKGVGLHARRCKGQ